MTDAQRMMSLFSGFSGAHGTHGASERNTAKNGKLEIKKTARTVQRPVTEQIWQEHLSGDRALGVIPVTEEGLCHWGCIDIDIYDLDHIDAVKKIEKKGFPLIVCRSKSGGAHAFLFLSTPASAEQVQIVLKEMSASLGWGGSEVFPKQTRILVERGDAGNWLNMPYFGGDETERYALKKSGAGCTLREFLDRAEKSRVELDDISEAQPREDKMLEEGPPCLQHLSRQGFPDGTRNNGLFALGVFCQKKFGERWEEKLEECNRNYMDPPLGSEEVMGVVRNLRKKEYQYTCKEQPLYNHCNSTLCRQRRYGIGGSGSWPVISGMSKLEAGEDTLWFLDIEGERVELSTRQLQNYREFQAVCMNQLTKFFMPLKVGDWTSMVAEAMQNAVIIEPAPEQTVGGHFFELLEEFCTNRYVGERRDDLLQGKPFFDEETSRHYFRLKDLMEHLEREKFQRWGRSKVGQIIREMGGKDFFNIKGKGVNVLWVPSNFQEMPKPEPPDSKKEAI